MPEMWLKLQFLDIEMGYIHFTSTQIYYIISEIQKE